MATFPRISLPTVPMRLCGPLQSVDRRRSMRATLAPDCLRGWVNAVGGDEHGAALFNGHDAVVLVPVVVGSTGGEEDRSQQTGDGIRRHIGMGVVGTD